MINITQFQAISASLIALLGFIFGIWKYFENKKLKRKALNREAYLKIVEIISSFTASADRCLSVLLPEKLYNATIITRSAKLQINNLENDLKTNDITISKLDELLTSYETENVTQSQVYECKFLLDKIKQKVEEARIKSKDADDLLEQSRIYLSNEEIDKDFEKAINTLIFNLESNPNWKLFSSDKAVSLINKIIDNAKSLRFEMNKTKLENTNSNNITILEISRQVFEFKAILEDFHEQLRKEVK